MLNGQQPDNTLLIELRLVNHKSEVKWYQLSASVQLTGKIAKRVAGSLISIQSAKNAQETIEKVTHLRKMTMSSIDKGAVIFDSSLKLIFANSYAEELLGKSSDQLMGTALEKLVEIDSNFQSYEDDFSYSWTHAEDYLFNASVRIKGSDNRLLEASVDELIYDSEKEYILYLDELEDEEVTQDQKRVFQQLSFIEKKFKELLSIADEDLLGITNQLSENVSRLNSIKDQATEEADQLIIKEMKDEFNKLIMDLQYHDALTQKIDHVLFSHDNLRQKDSYYQMLKPLLRLFICQMGSIRKEFSSLSQRIMDALYEIMKNKSIVEKAGLSYKEAFQNHHLLLAKIDEVVRHYRFINDSISKNGEIIHDNTVLDEIYQKYSMESEREVFATLFDWEVEQGSDDIELF